MKYIARANLTMKVISTSELTAVSAWRQCHPECKADERCGRRLVQRLC
jgi:hypothetical protein